MEATKRQIRKVFVIALGTLVVILGLLVGLLPGPGGIFVVLLGVSILSREIPWVRRYFRLGRTWVEKKWRTFRNHQKQRRVKRMIPLPPAHPPHQRQLPPGEP